MPDQALIEWVSLIKDALLGITTIVTMLVAIYGLRAWKRDLVGKEVYAAARVLLKESHLVCQAVRKLRQPLWPYEKRLFTEEEIKHTTENERWRMSEVEGYKEKLGKFSEELKRYESAKLELRVLIGSKVYEGFLPFGQHLTESIGRVNDYLDLLQDYSKTYLPGSSEVIKAQKKLYPSDNLDDELSQSIANSREKGEISLLSHLHRKSIYD
ncbi:TPA: hypothetical protein I8303_004044 [Aeromonas hydrophila]|uniref:hypothetical protein n=1 Tax=Aeromonas hydrophila TaxID=644 RepID=UPI000CB000FD|nr:hypothetical protein [Aeromonas hydrophila]PKD22991.1 hypothetical protein AO056_03640 [Aeromonas hydrophila]WRK92253.1 hypothetical protein U8518_00725 [Aeromonas hydrophila]HAT2715250.1 hypothetical protein [Aeromonas hydrophila]